jgi:hypothetical protein
MAERKCALRHYTAAGGVLQIARDRVSATTAAYQAELERVRSLQERDPWDHHEELLDQALEALDKARREMEIAWLEECL